MNRTNKIVIRAFNTIFGVSSLVLTGLLMTPSLQAQNANCPRVNSTRTPCEPANGDLPAEISVTGKTSSICYINAGSCCQYDRTVYYCDLPQPDGTMNRSGAGSTDVRTGITPGGECTNGKCVLPKTDEDELP